MRLLGPSLVASVGVVVGGAIGWTAIVAGFATIVWVTLKSGSQ